MNLFSFSLACTFIIKCNTNMLSIATCIINIKKLSISTSYQYQHVTSISTCIINNNMLSISTGVININNMVSLSNIDIKGSQY